MRRLAIAAIITGTLVPVTAVAHKAPLREVCRYQFEDDRKGWSVNEVERTIACAARRWPVSLSTARYVADRESNFYYKANNPYSSASGVYQIVSGTWQSFRGMFPKIDKWTSDHPYNARANVLLALKYAASRSWSPWI